MIDSKEKMPIRGGVKKRRSKGFARRVSTGGSGPLSSINAAPLPVATAPKVSTVVIISDWCKIVIYATQRSVNRHPLPVSIWPFLKSGLTLWRLLWTGWKPWELSLFLFCFVKSFTVYISCSPMMENLLRKRQSWQPCPRDISHPSNRSQFWVRNFCPFSYNIRISQNTN